MKKSLLLGALVLGTFVPLFAETSTPPPAAWSDGHPVTQQQWIINVGCSNGFLANKTCDYTPDGEPMKLRQDREYDFYDEFWAGNTSRRIKNSCNNIFERWDYNGIDGPTFRRTTGLDATNSWVAAGTSMRILETEKRYQIKNVPYERSTATGVIKFLVEYANDEAANTRYQHTECYPFVVSRCGDGIVDTDWYKKGPDNRERKNLHTEACDPNDPRLPSEKGWGTGTNRTCNPDCTLSEQEVKAPKCNSNDYNTKTKYTDLSSEDWLKGTEKLCDEGEVDSFRSSRNVGQVRNFTWYCKNSEGKRTDSQCRAKQEWCGDGVYNEDHEQCDPEDKRDPSVKGRGAGTYKTCNASCEIIDNDAACSSQYNGKNVYTSNSTHYLNGTASENLCSVGSLKQGTFGFNFIPGFPVYYQGNPYGPLQYKWLCENGKKTSSECTLKQYRCGDGDVNDGRNPRSFIDGAAHYEACDPKDPDSKGECGENCDYLPAICGPANSTTAVYNPNYPTSRIKESELCKTGKLKEGSFSGPDSNGNYKWECINVTKEELCGAKDLRCGDNKYQKDYEQCDPTDPNRTNWEEGTWKTCNSNCTLTGIVRNKPVCNSYFSGVNKYTEFDSTPWVKESDYLCTQGTKGGYTYSREGNKRVFKWTCSKDGYTVNCSASQTWCGDGVKNNNEDCDSKDDSHQGWGDGGCSQKCEPIYGPAKCGSEYNDTNNMKKEYLDINLSWLYENTPGLCDAGTVTGFRKHIDSPIYTWQCENHGKVSNECQADQEWCGDGIIQNDYEQCDPENPGWKNRTDGMGCSASCEKEWCGDGIVQKYLGEECDGGKGCTSQCKLVNIPQTGCDDYFTRSLRLGETKVFIDTGHAGGDNRYLYHQDVKFSENHGDYNNGANPIFNWTDQLVKAGMKLDANTSMQIIQSTPYHLITPPSVRAPNNLYVEYTVWYDNVRYEYIPSKDNLYSHKECFKYEISRCGDGVIDTGYNEVCDPGSEETKKAPDGQICNDKCEFEKVPAPVCNSKYNGQTVESLTEGPHLCSEGNYTTGSFNFNPQTNTWTWKCDNVAGIGKECSATKKVTPKGTPDIKKTLQNKVEVKEVGQKLDWEVKVTAKGGDITDFEIWDVMPNELNYLGWDYKDGKPDGLTVTKQDKVGTSGNNKVYYWDVKGTLKEGKSLTIIVRSEVKNMPASGANILNIACVNDDGKIICDPEPVPAVCNSVYSGQTVNDLKETDNLCIIGKVTGFKFDEATNKWTWGCNNEESTVSCWAQKPSSPKGEPEIEKTLKNKVIVNAVNQKLTWTVKVTAKGGDIKDFKVRDKLPKVLKYETYRVVKNEDNLKLPNQPSGPVESGSNNIYTWNVTGTLHQGHELILEIDSIVVKMPTKKDDYLNVACVEDDNKIDCDDAKPGTAEILKELQNKREVTETGQELDWKVTVIASGGDIENFEIWDKLPVELEYAGWKLDETNTQKGVTVTYDDNRSPKPSGDVNIHYWNVKGVLYSGNKITMIVKSTVKRMPTSGEDILNVACVVQSGNEIDCAEDNPPKPGGELVIQKTLNPKKTVTETGEILTWDIKVTASGGAVTGGFKISDIVPYALEFTGVYKIKDNPAKLTMGKWHKGDISDLKTWKGGEFTGEVWTLDVNGGLKQNQSLVLTVTTRVVKMPKTEDDYRNVACVIKDDTQECDDDKPKQKPDLRIKKHFTDGTKSGKVVKIGDEIAYRITFGNSGNSVASITSIKDFLPKNVKYKSSEIFVNGKKIHTESTQSGDKSIFKGFKAVDGIHIDIYGGIDLNPGYTGYIILTGEVLRDFTGYTTNFACIYLNDDVVDCDDATHKVEAEVTCKTPEFSPSTFDKVCASDKSEFSTTVTCKSDGGKADIEIICDGKSIKTGYAQQLTGTCSSTTNNKDNKVQCKVNGSLTGTDGKVCEASFRRDTKSCGGGCINCGGGGGPTPPTDYCDKNSNDPICLLADPRCFNVNAGNFSIESGEILPFYFNVYRKESSYTYKYLPNESDDATCDSGTIDLSSLRCKYKILSPDHNRIVYSGEFDCLQDNAWVKNDTLIGQWAKTQDDRYGINLRDDNGSTYWPTIETSNSSGWKINDTLGEYKFQIEVVDFRQCTEENKWTRARDDEHYTPGAVCQSNFVLTAPYTVQKTPSGNLRASTVTLAKFKEVDGDDVGFSKYLDAISTTAYTPTPNVDNAMNTFIEKYKKLAVEVDTEKFGKNGVTVKKVPGKDIYFIDGNATFVQNNTTINKPFTIVQTNGSTTINGNLNHNMMLLTKGNITFSGNCTTGQTVRGIFYAQGNLVRQGVKKNNNPNNNVWCTNGGLNIKGVLIGNNFDDLMMKSRSHLETWFQSKGNNQELTNKVMNGASVVIEYSPSIFTKSTMPPGAEDFTTALSIYKN